MNHEKKHYYKVTRSVCVELHRAILSGTFVLEIVLLLAWEFANFAASIYDLSWLKQASIVTTFDAAVSNLSALARLLLPIVTVLFSWSGETDRRSRYLASAIQRVGLPAYCAAKVLAVALSAMLVVFLAETILVFALMFSGMPLRPWYPMDNCQYYLIARKSVISFIIVREVISSLTAALSAVFALTLGAFLHNALASMIGPLIAYYAWDVAAFILKIPSNGLLLDCIFFSQPFPDPVFSAVWSTTFMITLTVLLGKLYAWKVGKDEYT